ncbi:hypothetical protein AVEN_111815-1 [Araneus ventricosus]|uniref:Uncharacterized protein n=1 Tax=Araneus ventricosus TaxID=182803 RepID=A0A4Y2JIY6_ARAVE|nr:hypothetical protein AVEN_111815-1 [Araneus ventricosus]
MVLCASEDDKKCLLRGSICRPREFVTSEPHTSTMPAEIAEQENRRRGTVCYFSLSTKWTLYGMTHAKAIKTLDLHGTAHHRVQQGKAVTSSGNSQHGAIRDLYVQSHLKER